MHKKTKFWLMLACLVLAPLVHAEEDSGEPADSYMDGLKILFYEGPFSARTYARELGQKNDPAGKALLSYMYLKGYGVKHDLKQSRSYARQAASKGHSVGNAIYGRFLLLSKKSTERKHGYARMQKAIDSNHPEAMAIVARCYFFGDECRKDLLKAASLARQASEAGSPTAAHLLSIMYEDGLGVDKNSEEAEYNTLLAAQRGEPESRTWYVRQLYEEGSLLEAYEAGESVARLGFARGKEIAGLALLQGNDDLPQNTKKGLKLVREAANEGSYTAQYGLGRLYEAGVFVTENRLLAADYYFKAGVAANKDGNRELAFKALSKIQELNPRSREQRILASRIRRSDAGQDSGVEEGQSQSVSSGTGWVAAPGYVVTNHHVIEGASNIRVLLSTGKKLKAKLVVSDANNDVAILSVSNIARLPRAIPLARGKAATGGRVFAIGFPLPDSMGQSAKLTNGIINAQTGIGDDPRWYQISVPIQPGNSGGPLLNYRGEVVGITSASLSDVKTLVESGAVPQNVNYAIKIPYARILLDTLPAKRKPKALPVGKASLQTLMKRIRPSVVQVLATSN